MNLNTSDDASITEEKKKSIRKIWTTEEDEKLIKLAEEKGFRDWNNIALNFPGKDEKQCNSRFHRINPKYSRGPWTKEEEERLYNLIAIHGFKWSTISKRLTSRNLRQIRDKWKQKFSLDCTLKKVKENENNVPEKFQKLLRKRFRNNNKQSFYSKEISGREQDKDISGGEYDNNNSRLNPIDQKKLENDKDKHLTDYLTETEKEILRIGKSNTGVDDITNIIKNFYSNQDQKEIKQTKEEISNYFSEFGKHLYKNNLFKLQENIYDIIVSLLQYQLKDSIKKSDTVEEIDLAMKLIDLIYEKYEIVKNNEK